jgi:small subunit ribosomal protein S17
MAKQLEGKIISNKMTGTVVVQVERFVKHPRFKKIMRRMSKLKAHTAKHLNIGDKVTIEECKPVAKTVNFVVKD